jgi:ABC transport system ATP-binding/permease protein
MVTFRDQPLHVSAWAKRFLFTNEQLEMPVKSLSGGEQARILIAKLMLRPADLLLLDEPTNDLDIPSLQVLEESLAEFPGAVVLVTHDRFMLRRLATEILAFDGAGGVALYSDFSQWVNAREAAREQVAAAKKADTPRPAAKESTKTAKKLSFKEQREFEQMEGAILEAEAAVAALQQELETPTVAADPQRLNACCKALADAQARVDSLYARWQELEAKQQ